MQVLFKCLESISSICIEMFEDKVSKTKNLKKNFMFKKMIFKQALKFSNEEFKAKKESCQSYSIKSLINKFFKYKNIKA